MAGGEDWELVRWEALRRRGAEAATPDGWEPEGDEGFEEVAHGL